MNESRAVDLSFMQLFTDWPHISCIEKSLSLYIKMHEGAMYIYIYGHPIRYAEIRLTASSDFIYKSSNAKLQVLIWFVLIVFIGNELIEKSILIYGTPCMGMS